MSATNTASNKRIAKNTLALYVRMGVSLLIGLYTGRVVLQVLGVDDYGIYNIVGGVVGMLAFLNATMSGATSRFIAFELGRHEQQRLKLTFRSALLVHALAAIVVAVVLETGGLWFLYNKLVIPECRMAAAVTVFHISVLSSVLGIVSVPFNSLLIAHEKIDVFAVLDMVGMALKLAVVILIQYISYDSLITYAVLLLMVQTLMAAVGAAYGFMRFDECELGQKVDGGIVRDILSFTAYNLFGNFSSIFNLQGTNILINKFFGVAVNAAVGIGMTVSNMVGSFANNMLTAFRPPITKAYASGNMAEVESMLSNAFLLAVSLFSLFAVPAAVEMDTLLKLWLVNVPAHTATFSRIILFCILFEVIRHIATIAIHATGKVKLMSVCNGVLLTLNPFIVYLLFIVGSRAYLAYVSYLAVSVVLAAASLVITKKLIPELSVRTIIVSLTKLFICMLLALIMTLWFSTCFEAGFARLVLSSLFSSVVLATLTFGFCLNKRQRQAAVDYVKVRLPRLKP